MPNADRDMKIARILIIISIIFGIFVAVTVLYIGIAGFYGRIALPGLFPAGAIAIGVVKIIGIGIGLLALQTLRGGSVRRAGAYALVASFLPPLDLIMLLAALFLLPLRRGSEPA